MQTWKMAPAWGHSLTSGGVLVVAVVTLLDDHDLVGVTVAPAMIPMIAVFGAGAVAVVMAATPLDDHGLGVGDRRGRHSNGNQGRDDIAKLLHDVLLVQYARIEH